MTDRYEGIDHRGKLFTLMEKLGGDDKVRIVHIVFDTAFVKTYKRPSDIPYSAVGDTAWPPDLCGYWKGGKLHKFNEKLTTDYTNSCYSDR